MGHEINLIEEPIDDDGVTREILAKRFVLLCEDIESTQAKQVALRQRQRVLSKDYQDTREALFDSFRDVNGGDVARARIPAAGKVVVLEWRDGKPHTVNVQNA